MVQNFASAIAKNDVSEAWVTRFINRNSLDLISHWATGMDQTRHAADSGIKYKRYFDLLHDKLEQYNMEPRQIYNMDEKGFMIGITARTKHVFSRAAYKRKRGRESLQDGSREWVTLLVCCCADGTALSPGLLFCSQNQSIYSAWLDAINPAEHHVFVGSTPSGWSNNDVGLAWLEQVFNRETTAKARSSYRLLIVDGHGSHVTKSFIDYCDAHKILLLILPPHSTQTLQPLDVVLFKPLATYYAKELQHHLYRAQGLLPVKKGDFFELFWRAWQLSFTAANILSAFRSTEIAPFNPNVILQRFDTEQSSRESSASALSAEDWRRLDRLVRSAVRDQGTADAKQLRSSLHHIAIQNQLLREEIGGLRQALRVKTRYKKQSSRSFNRLAGYTNKRSQRRSVWSV
jgi:hypothetical protein